MKRKNQYVYSMALVSILMLGLIFAACKPAPDDGTLVFEATTNGGDSYTLTITQNTAAAAFSPAQGDSYVLEFTKAGVSYVSRGTVQNFSNNILILQPSYAGVGTFSVQVSNEKITGIMGAIAVEGANDPILPPGPGSFPAAGGGNNTSRIQGTFSAPGKVITFTGSDFTFTYNGFMFAKGTFTIYVDTIIVTITEAPVPPNGGNTIRVGDVWDFIIIDDNTLREGGVVYTRG